jgi:hypothetical protein
MEAFFMKKSKLFLTGIPALALVFGLLMTGCGTSPQAVPPQTPQNDASDSSKAEVNAVAAIQGAWEKTIPNGGSAMLFFLGETYALYFNNELGDDGVFTIDGTKLYLWPYDTSFYLYTFAISDQGLTLTKNDAPVMSGLWKKSSYSESTENSIVGYWKHEADNTINILRFYPWGGGSWFHCDKKTMEVVKSEELKFDLAAAGAFQQIIKLGGEGFSGTFPVDIQYTLEGDSMVLTKDGSVYKKVK